MSVTITKLIDTFLLPDAQVVLSTIDELVGQTPSPFTPEDLKSLITLCNKSQNILTQTLVKAFFEFIRDKNPNITVGRDPLLLWACDKNMPNMALALLKAGAYPNVADVNGDTPILITITKLQKQGLSPDIIKKYQELLKELSKTADTTVVNNLGIMILQNKEGSTPEEDKRIGDRPGKMKHSVFSGDFFVWYPSSTSTAYNSVYTPPVVTKEQKEQREKNIQARLAELPEIIQQRRDIYKDSKPLANAYFVAGHGGPGTNTFTVPKGCIIVVKAKEGMTTSDLMFSKVCELTIDELKNPLKYADKLINTFSSLAIYKEGDECPNFTYTAISCTGSGSAGYKRCDSFGSGILDLTKIKLTKCTTGSNREDELSSLTFENDTQIGDYVANLFINSIFPTKTQVEKNIFTTTGFFTKTKIVDPNIGTAGEPTTVGKINKILNVINAETTQQVLCKKSPGVYYNFVCRGTRETMNILKKIDAPYTNPEDAYKGNLSEIFTNKGQFEKAKQIQISQILEAEKRKQLLIFANPYNASKESTYLRQRTYSEQDILDIFDAADVEALLLPLKKMPVYSGVIESKGFKIKNFENQYYIYSPYRESLIGYIRAADNNIIIYPEYKTIPIYTGGRRLRLKPAAE